MDYFQMLFRARKKSDGIGEVQALCRIKRTILHKNSACKSNIAIVLQFNSCVALKFNKF